MQNDVTALQKQIKDVTTLTNEYYSLVTIWAKKDIKNDTPSKLKLKAYLQSNELQEAYLKLYKYRYLLDKKMLFNLMEIEGDISTILDVVVDITQELTTEAAYDNPMVAFLVYPRLEAKSLLHNSILSTDSLGNVIQRYADELKNKKSLTDYVVNLQQSDPKTFLIFKLFDQCKLQETLNAMSINLKEYSCYFNYDEEQELKRGLYKRFVLFYESQYSIEELNQLIDFYSSPLGLKMLEINGFINIKVLRQVLSNT